MAAFPEELNPTQTSEAGKQSAEPVAPRSGEQNTLALVLFGSPGSGKGTQSKLLVERLGIPQISTGDMLREHIRVGDDIGQKIEHRMRSGLLVSDELANQLVEERLKMPDTRKGFILDGYPRTVSQGEVLLDLLRKNHAEAVVIHLVVDYNVIIARITGRRQCPKCGTLYNLVSRPPKSPNVCDLDGESLIIREDDREEIVRERLAAYERQTAPLIQFFRSAGSRMYDVDASQVTPQALSDRIFGLLCAESAGLREPVVVGGVGKREGTKR